VMGARLVVNRILNELEGRQPDVIEVQVVGAADALHRQRRGAGFAERLQPGRTA